MQGPIALVPIALISDGRKTAFGDQLAGEPDEIRPPVLLGAVLRPAWLRHDEPMRPRGARHDRPLTVDKNAFRLVGADVHAEIDAHRS